MNDASRDVSLVFETANDDPRRRIRFADVVGAWKGQTRADRVLEWIVVAGREPTPAEKALLEGTPTRWLVREGLVYYQQKNAGVPETVGAFVAFADSDAFPDKDWLERALSVLERSDANVALVTGRSRYQSGPFSREMEIAQLGDQSDDPHDTTVFLAHNVLFRGDVLRARGLFQGDSDRIGSDNHLASRLIEAGHRLHYDPTLRFTHHYNPRWGNLYQRCVRVGYHYGSFERHMGAPHPNPFWDFAGRVRVLFARLLRWGRPVGIPLWRLPLSALYLVFYSVGIAHGYERAWRGKPKPFALD